MRKHNKTRCFNSGDIFGSVSKKVSGSTVSPNVRDMVSLFVHRSTKCQYLWWETVRDVIPYKRAVCKKQHTKCSYYRCEFRDKVLSKDFDF